MKLRAYAKINLGLDVLRKRNDGYHDLEMVMQSVSLYDELEINLINSGFEISCSNSAIPLDHNNLICKTGLAVQKYTGNDFGFRVHLVKNIPFGAGLGGGSADAAATLIALNNLLDLSLSPDELIPIGKSIGADVPFCLLGGTRFAQGIGEILAPIDAYSSYYIVLAKPEVNISTASVFQKLSLDMDNIHPSIRLLKEDVRCSDLTIFTSHMGNYLSSVTETDYPIIRNIRKHLDDCGAAISLMSGSGPTVFGIFDNKEKAQYANEGCKKLFALDCCTVTAPVNMGVEIIH